MARFPLDPAQAAAWSAKLQAAGAGEALAWSVRSQILPYVALLVWAVYPLTYFAYLVQQLAIQRRLLGSPWRNARDIITALRTRGER